jgi:hypothetical protein
VRTVELLREHAHHFRAGRVGQPLELLEMFVERLACARPLERRSNEERPLSRRLDVDQFS